MGDGREPKPLRAAKRGGGAPVLQEAFEAVDGHVGCGDNSCAFKRPTGMATNGGCRCRDRPFVIGALARLYAAVRDHLGTTAAKGRPRSSASPGRKRTQEGR